MRYSGIIATTSIVLLGLLTACGAATPAAFEAPMAQPPAREAVVEAPPQVGAEAPAQPDQGALPSGAIIYRTSAEQQSASDSARLIIKDAQIKLLVEDTDRAIDGIMQVVGDLGGYVLSSRVWYQQWGPDNYKYAAITIGVPAVEFERAIRRLRSLAIRVTDETTTGQDVTDEYVDLQSRLESLQATRGRILDFLDRANTVDEALKVNQELATVEGQIEEVQGRINYLSGRASYSTITISLEPQLPDILPTPTPTQTLTPTPTPTRTPTPWDASKTFQSAKLTLGSIYQGFAEIAIWLIVVFVPIVGPVALIVWLIWHFTRRKPGRPSSQ